MKFKKFLGFFFLMSLFVAFVCFVIWGESGLVKYVKAKTEVKEEEKRVLGIKKELSDLSEEINNLKSDSFYLEKIARENLIMGGDKELVYMLK